MSDFPPHEKREKITFASTDLLCDPTTPPTIPRDYVDEMLNEAQTAIGHIKDIKAVTVKVTIEITPYCTPLRDLRI